MLTFGQNIKISMKISVTKSTNSGLHHVNFNDLPFGKIFSDHMFLVEYQDGAWHNPRIEPFHHFNLHPATMALHYGQAIFEGMKASKNASGTPMLFRPELHAERLNKSARRMCMPELPEDLFLEALRELIKLDSGWIPPQEGSALYIRPTMIATDGFIGVRPSQSYLFFIITCPVGPYYSKPVRLYAETNYVRAVEGGTGEAKAAGNYAAAMLPSRLAQSNGYDQILWLDAKEFKYIQESGVMNIFFVIDGKVLTPPLYGTILDGITRRSAIELLRDAGYEVEEYSLTIDEVVAAYHAGQLQEAFGTGTAAVASQIEAIAYKDLIMELPNGGNGKIGQFVKESINHLRSGAIADTKGWTVPIG